MVAHKWARWLHNPCRVEAPTALEREAESEMAHKWARWLHNPCHLGCPHRFKAGARIRSGQGGYITRATRGVPSALERGQNQRWPTSGQGGYITPAAGGSPSL